MTTASMASSGFALVEPGFGFQRDNRYGVSGKCAVPGAEVEHFAVHCSLSGDGSGCTPDAVGHGPMAGCQHRTDEQGRQRTISHANANNVSNEVLPCWSLEGRSCGA